MASSHLGKLDTIQRKAARIILNVPSDSHAEPRDLLKQLGLSSLQDRRTARVLKVVIDSTEGNCHPGLANKFREEDGEDGTKLKLPGAKSSMGRKRFSYYGADLFNNI